MGARLCEHAQTGPRIRAHGRVRPQRAHSNDAGTSCSVPWASTDPNVQRDSLMAMALIAMAPMERMPPSGRRARRNQSRRACFFSWSRSRRAGPEPCLVGVDGSETIVDKQSRVTRRGAALPLSVRRTSLDSSTFLRGCPPRNMLGAQRACACCRRLPSVALRAPREGRGPAPVWSHGQRAHLRTSPQAACTRGPCGGEILSR
jgi:hypothetical protein